MSSGCVVRGGSDSHESCAADRQAARRRSVLEVVILEAGQTPRIRITERGQPARILGMMLVPVESGEPIWALGPVGTVATMSDGVVTECRQASPQEVAQLEARADRDLGEFVVSVLELAYGDQPAGLH